MRIPMVVAAVLAALALPPVLPAALPAETEPHPVEIVPVKDSGNETPPEKDAESQRSAREKLALNKLTLKRPAPEEPAPEEPAPEEPAPQEPIPEEPPPKEPTPQEPVQESAPDRDQSPDQGQKRAIRGGATRVPVLPGPARKASAKPPPKAAPPAAKQEEEPRDDQLLLSIPRLEIEKVPVGDSREQAYLDLEGIMHLSGTGFPREQGSNTYIAGHAADYDTSRIPNVFHDLPSIRQGDLITLRDAAGKTYRYRVYERLVVTPLDVWVTHPVPGKQVVSLQTCFPAPTYDKRLIVRGQLIG